MDHLGIDNVKGSGIFLQIQKEADENDCQAQLD